MPAQYVAPTKFGLFRIVRHGRRWRSLLEESELARHDDADAALAYLRGNCPQARLPATLQGWRPLALADATWAATMPGGGRRDELSPHSAALITARKSRP